MIVGSAITGPIGKECADLWPRIASAANAIVWEWISTVMIHGLFVALGYMMFGKYYSACKVYLI